MHNSFVFRRGKFLITSLKVQKKKKKTGQHAAQAALESRQLLNSGNKIPFSKISVLILTILTN